MVPEADTVEILGVRVVVLLGDGMDRVCESLVKLRVPFVSVRDVLGLWQLA